MLLEAMTEVGIDEPVIHKMNQMIHSLKEEENESRIGHVND
jgi:hypothetical protein